MPTTQEKIMALELRVKRLENDLAILRANYFNTQVAVYEPIPYYLHPDFKMPQAKG